ncbi:MAG: alkaline phosphatase D family protein [Bdellovibrionota bacterium]
MLIGRRKFLLSAGVATVAFTGRKSWSQGAVPVGAPPYGFPVVQLHTDDTSAQFRLLVNPLRPTIYEATTIDGTPLPLAVLSSTVNPFVRTEALDHVLVEGLQSGRDYLLKAYDEKTGAQVEERIFRALDTRPRVARFVVASCMMDVLEAFQDAMFDAVQKSKPEVIFFIGDTTYTDIGGGNNVADNWRRHIESRRIFNFGKWKRLVPIYATWDDHDFGGNNMDGTLSRKVESLKAFKAMWGWTPRGTALTGHGVSSHVELCGQRFYLMDDRFFRDSAATSSGNQWGPSQENWLMTSISSSATPTWIMNGGQFFGGYLGKESFEYDHPQELARITQTLRELEAPAVLVSGDVHFSELMTIEKAQLGYETFEVTSSSLLSTTNPIQDTKKVNPRRLTSTWHHNFVVIDSDPRKPGGLDFRVRSIGRGLKVYFDKTCSVRRV